MATVTTRICDRCKKEIKYLSWTGKLRKGSKYLKFEKILIGNLDGYSWSETTVELCAECTAELMAWLRNEQKEVHHD